MLIVCGDFGGIHKSTCSGIVKLVSHHLALLRPQFIDYPEDEQEFDQIKQAFYNIAKFPGCIGALDCTHIKIKSPGGPQAENYRNRKNFFSINLQTVYDAAMKIRNIVARWPGSAHDSTIFNNSHIRGKFERGEMRDYLIVANAGYALKKYLLTPIQHPVTPAEKKYNAAQILTRNPIERSYGLWKRRFPILSVGMNLKIDTVQSVIVATAVLHNIACDLREKDPKVPHHVQRLINITNFRHPTGNLENIRDNDRETRNCLVRSFETQP